MKKQIKIDKVRASRDGHEYHEAWTARKALQLLRPGSDLVAIAVEGLSPNDQAGASAQTVEIADLVLYYGGRPTFEEASRTIFAQFKYSVAYKNKDFRASHAKKTIQKFAKTYRDYKNQYGAEAVNKKLDFQLVTNQPIYEPLLKAVEAIAKGASRTGEVEHQAKQFIAAASLSGTALASFAEKCKFIGRSGSLPAIKDELASLIVDWSATNDPIASARLGQLRDMVRKKAGYAGTNQNLITRTDILAALNVGDPMDLLPCESALSDVGEVLEREQLADAIIIIESLPIPLLIHAAGGVGKTVFMDSLAAKMRERCEVVFFDCFGGGAYRSPEDARHLPKKGLIHIANTLAFRGLCDPMLPENPDAESLLRTFRRRLVQCVDTISRATPGRGLALFIDAIDNAEIAARQRSEDCFPIKLLESLDTKPIPGLHLIVSCRTERKPFTYAKYHELELRRFNITETSTFLRVRLKDVSHAEINVAQARSGGNPRVLNYLVVSGRGLLDESEINKKIELDELIQSRISDALAMALERGYKQADIDAFLAGLAVLPPPVPIEEYAGAHGLEPSTIESFASDLFPLLERSNQGLMFKDEPTETFVRKQYASSKEPLRRLAENLNARQDMSVYAARSLPGLLHELGDGEKLFTLAFDDRLPVAITSTVGKRNIRYARLKAATRHAAINKDFNRLVRLLLELSTIAAVDQRGAAYILDHPDLVVAAKDVDATRRLFETRTGWPGTRHARLAIANTLSGDSDEAYRHAIAANEWIRHYSRTYSDDRVNEPGPERPDIAAIPFFLVTESKAKDAAQFLKGWRDWYAYEVCEYIFGYLHLAQSLRSQSPRRLTDFINALSDIGPLTASLSFHELSNPKRKELIRKLAKSCSKTSQLPLSESYNRHSTYQLQDGLRKAAAIALSSGLNAEALAISLRAPHRRPGSWSFRDIDSGSVFPFVFRVALVAAAKGTTLHEKDVLPQTLASICSRISRTITGGEFHKKAKDSLSKYCEQQRKEGNKAKATRELSHDERQELERFIDRRLEPLLSLTKALSNVLAAPARNVDKAFAELLKAWEEARKNRDPYQTGQINHFFGFLGLDMALFVLWVRTELKLASVKSFLATLEGQGIGAHKLGEIVSILAKRPPLHHLAGAQALKARTLIETEHDVTSRSSLFASLGRAILPASNDEASVYFREGLEQMDAIGSGDYEFTNELLLFAASIKGEELNERDFHTLSNICELNIGEPDKFFWGAYGRGLSRVAGPRGMAKLSRWDDRSTVSLKYTLLPYLIGLVEDEKLSPEDALALNLLADPVEFYVAGTAQFAQAIRKKAGPDPDIISELIQQFEDNNPKVPMPSTVEALAPLAREALGPSSDTAKYLSAAHKHYANVVDAQNDHMNYSSAPSARMRKHANQVDRKNRDEMTRLVAAANPADATSLSQAINAFNSLQNTYELKGAFLSSLRAKVPYNARAQYIRDICALENLSLYWKIGELKDCKQAWASSSAALNEVYRNMAIRLIHLHEDDLVDYGRLSNSTLIEISDLTGVPIADLILELIKAFAQPDNAVAGAIWLAFASFICPQTEDGQAQLALARLLGSEAAKLADNVADGPWLNGLYPKDDITAIESGLIWHVLGSPYAEERWRATHSIRCFARFGRWEVLDSLARNLSATGAGPFQDSKLAFFYMHARLWLLIAFARLALDYPKQVARYKNELLSIVTDEESPHVLMRHFAARTLVTCIDAGELKLGASIEDRVRNADLSPYPRLKEKVRNGGGFYQGRPSSAPKPEFEFHLDYDFHKQDVDNLSHIFGKECWEVADMIAAIVHQIDPNVTSMYETDGRESPFQRHHHGMTTGHHTHGQQLGWHALFLAAGKLLARFPVTNDWWYEDDPWGEWLGRYLLTRQDGLWLSDGTDRMPLDTAVILLEKTKKGLAITGDPDKLLQLAGLTSRVGKQFIVEGSWTSADNIKVDISSALVPPDKAVRLARKLIREDPFMAWLPVFQEMDDDFEYLRGEKKEYLPWIVSPSGETRLDEHTPYGVYCANHRPHLAREFAALCSLSTDDPFGRIWQDKKGKPMLYAHAWGREDKYSEDGSHSGLRLICASSVLRKILTKYDKNLLVLIKLERYEKGSYHQNSSWTHSVAVVRITRTLDIEYFKGFVNHLHRSQY